MLAAMILGAEGVQIGSRFVASTEANSHINFKNAVIQAEEGDTSLTLTQITPVRMMKNKFFDAIQLAEQRGVPVEKLQALVGKGRAKRGMFEGDLDEGELEIGQACALINKIQPTAAVTHDLWHEFTKAPGRPLK
jgi:enoyl-[acyl-carrier protein] reductase II